MVTHFENQILAKAAVPGVWKCHMSRRNSELKTGKHDRDLDQILIEGPQRGRWSRSEIPKKTESGIQRMQRRVFFFLIVRCFLPAGDVLSSKAPA